MKVSVGRHLEPIEANVWVRRGKGEASAKAAADKYKGICKTVFPANGGVCCGFLVALDMGGNHFVDKNGQVIEAKRKWTNKELERIAKQYAAKNRIDNCPLCGSKISDHNLDCRWETNWAICSNPECTLESQSFIVNMKNDKICSIEFPYYLYEIKSTRKTI